MKPLKTLLFSLAVQFCILSIAKGAEKRFPAKNIKTLVIQAPFLHVKVKHSKSSFYSLKGAEALIFQENQDILFIKSKNFSSKKTWSDKNLKKRLSLEVSGPSNDLQIFSYSSNISISNWLKPVFISSFKGQIKANNTKGAWQIDLKEGGINMTRHKSPLKVKSFQVRFMLTKSEGDFEFQVNEGKINIKNSKGQINFINDKPKVQLTQFNGNLKGFSRLGAVQASLQANEVEVSTKEGLVRLYFVNQGPKVKAYTEEGKIYAPKHFYKKFSGKSTFVSGRMKSKTKKGKVSIQTERGNIYIN